MIVHREGDLSDQVATITFNANVVAHTPVSIYRFLLVNFPKAKYFIDPQTYIFQLDPIKYYSTRKSDKTVLKSSVEALVKEYGELGRGLINTLEIQSVDKISSHITDFTKCVLEFQYNYLYNQYIVSDNKIDGSEDYDSDEIQKNYPEYLICPYTFLCVDAFDKLLKLNIDFINSAYEYANIYQSNFAAELVIDKSIIINENKRENILTKYNENKIKTIFLWIDDFDETDINIEYIRSLISFLKGFQDKEIIILYGGFLSLILAKIQIIKGFCHGPGYGESRGVKPVGGGIPTAKYYLPLIKKRIDYEQAYSVLKIKNLLNEKYFSEICGCNKCKDLLIPKPNETNFNLFGKYKLAKSLKNEIPTEDTLVNNQEHYILKRFIEIEDSLTIDIINSNFSDFIAWNKEHKEISTQHLENWLNVINESK